MESRLQHNILLDTVATGQAGLESFQTPYYNMARGKERHKLIQQGMCVEMEETSAEL